MITPPWIGLCVIVRRFSMAIEGVSSGVEASLAARSRIWGFPSSRSFAGGGGIRFAVSVGYEPSCCPGRHWYRGFGFSERVRSIFHLTARKESHI